jgi:hypothetical protein
MDEILAEVRSVRDEYAARFHYDLWEMYHDLKEKEQAHAADLATLKPVTPQAPAAA